MHKSRVWMFFVALAGLCWGVYVPLVAEGGKELHNPFAAFLCVGAAYFFLRFCYRRLPAVRGQEGWSGTAAASVCPPWPASPGPSAPCASFSPRSSFGGPPMFVAPVVFALAPVINTIVSLFWHPDEGAFTLGAPREPVHWSLYLGVVLAGLGAAWCCSPRTCPAPSPDQDHGVNDYTFVIFVLLAGLSWGVYVPLIAQGGKDLKSSYASFLCVGAAYFVIAVLLPLAMLWYHERPAASSTRLTCRCSIIQPASLLPRSPARPGPSGALRHLRHLRVQRPAPLRRPGHLRPGAGHQHHRHPILAPDGGRADDVRVHAAPHWLARMSASSWPALAAGMVLFAKELTEAKHAAHLRPPRPPSPRRP